MPIEEAAVSGHPIGEPHAGFVVPDEFLELGLGELGAPRAHQMSAIMPPVGVACRPPDLREQPLSRHWTTPGR